MLGAFLGSNIKLGGNAMRGAYGAGVDPFADAFIFTVKTDNAGTSNDDQSTIQKRFRGTLCF